MNLIYNLMGDRSAALIDQLTRAGLGIEQAQEFLPEALQSVMGGLQKIDTQSLLGDDIETQTANLTNKINIEELAGRLGGDIGLTNSGLQAIIPEVLGFLKNNPTAASLLGLPGSEGSASGLMRLAKGLIH